MDEAQNQHTQLKLTLLEALNKASKDVPKNPIYIHPNLDAIKAILKLKSEAETEYYFTDPSLFNLSKSLSNLKTQLEELEKSQDYALRSFICRQIACYRITQIASSIESQVQAWIDQQNIRNLVQILKQCANEDEKVKVLIQFENRVLMGFDGDLQEMILKAKVFSILESIVSDSTFPIWVGEQSAIAIVALVRFNKDVFVGQVLMGPTIQNLISMASYKSIQVLSSLIKLIKSPLVYEIESNGDIPRILSLLGSQDSSIRVAAIDCVLEFAYFVSKEAIELVLEYGLIENLMELQRLEYDSDLVENRVICLESENRGILVETELEREIEGEEREFLGKFSIRSCLNKFVVQLEMGEGLEEREKRQLKQEILRRVREASVSDAEATDIIAEILWGSSPWYKS